MSVLNASDACPNDIHGLLVGVRNSFDLALKLALYTFFTKTVRIQCVLPTRPSKDGKCHWSVLEN